MAAAIFKTLQRLLQTTKCYNFIITSLIKSTRTSQNTVKMLKILVKKNQGSGYLLIVIIVGHLSTRNNSFETSQGWLGLNGPFVP